MKANQKFVNGDDEAVSPVIAVILMVAITVVLAATVYLFVSGFGSNQSEIVTASFAAKAVDVPGGDADTTDDSIELTYSSGTGDLASGDVELFINGRSLTWLLGSFIYVEGGTLGQNDLCTNDPANDNDAIWERGSSVHITLNEAAAPAAADCGANPTTSTNQGNMDTVGVWSVKAVVRGQVVLDTSIEVHDDGGA